MLRKNIQKYQKKYHIVWKIVWITSCITIKPKNIRDKNSKKISIYTLVKIIKNRAILGNFVKKQFINYIFDKISNPKIILEIGSRDAIQSIEFSKLFPKAKIYAFECYPPCIRTCIKNTKSFKNIEIIQKAIFNKNDEISFYPLSKNIGSGSVLKVNDDSPIHYLSPIKKITVEATRIDTWAKEKGIKKIDLVWIDLQGAEYEAFEGMGEYLQNIQAIYTEVENKELYTGQKLMKDVSRLLNENGLSFLKYTQISRDLWGNAIYINNNLIK